MIRLEDAQYKIQERVMELIKLYTENREMASTNTSCYRTCENAMLRLKELNLMSERLFGITIDLNIGPGNQYTPGKIKGWSIDFTGRSKDDLDFDDEKEW